MISATSRHLYVYFYLKLCFANNFAFLHGFNICTEKYLNIPYKTISHNFSPSLTIKPVTSLIMITDMTNSQKYYSLLKQFHNEVCT